MDMNYSSMEMIALLIPSLIGAFLVSLVIEKKEKRIFTVPFYGGIGWIAGLFITIAFLGNFPELTMFKLTFIFGLISAISYLLFTMVNRIIDKKWR